MEPHVQDLVDLVLLVLTLALLFFPSFRHVGGTAVRQQLHDQILPLDGAVRSRALLHRVNAELFQVVLQLCDLQFLDLSGGQADMRRIIARGLARGAPLRRCVIFRGGGGRTARLRAHLKQLALRRRARGRRVRSARPSSRKLAAERPCSTIVEKHLRIVHVVLVPHHRPCACTSHT